MAQVGYNKEQYDTDRSRLRFGQSYEFLLDDGSIVIGGAYDSCVITGALFGAARKDVCWTKVVGFRSIYFKGEVK